MKAVTNHHVSVAVDGSHAAFQMYIGGILKQECRNELNHAVTAIGTQKQKGQSLGRTVSCE